MNGNRPPEMIHLLIALEVVVLSAFLVLLSPLGKGIADSVPASGVIGERTEQEEKEGNPSP